jgi:hypothetical protein
LTSDKFERNVAKLMLHEHMYNYFNNGMCLRESLRRLQSLDTFAATAFTDMLNQGVIMIVYFHREYVRNMIVFCVVYVWTLTICIL